jgi:hypothetical protein
MKKKNLATKEEAKAEKVAAPVLPIFNDSMISSNEEKQQDNVVAEIDRLWTGVPLNFYFFISFCNIYQFIVCILKSRNHRNFLNLRRSKEE